VHLLGNYVVYDLAIFRSEQKHAIAMFKWMLKSKLLAKNTLDFLLVINRAIFSS
jgi:hypothetical protein